MGAKKQVFTLEDDEDDDEDEKLGSSGLGGWSEG